MHVKHSVHIDRSVQDVSETFLRDPAAWFPRSVGLHVSGFPLRKDVTVEFGNPVRTSTWAVLPLTWRATTIQKLFPVMHGKVELAPVSKDETRLTVSGMYQPPLGKVGEELDAAVLYHVAHGTVKELAEWLAGELEVAVKS